jgi:polyisoprenyl-teichoic acid--peptidoglycan teichoic acid transferase
LEHLQENSAGEERMNKFLSIVKNPRYIILAVVALLLFFGSLFGVRVFVVTQDIFQMDGVAIRQAQATSDALDLPTPAPIIPLADLPPPWDGASRVNILLLGVDSRAEVNDGPPRSDSVLIVTIDPQSKTAGLFSIPRDMWVNIPGYGYGRINQAYAFGEGSRLPGGGPAMTMRTVEQFLGVPIHYYGQVDFATFEAIVDHLGGIRIYIDEEVRIDPRGPGGSIITEPGNVYYLEGRYALAYARARYTEDGDVDRARRQQAVILAMRDKALDPANFPTLIAKAPAIYEELQQGINTNMRFEDALRLAVFLQQVPLENIKRGVIDFSMALIEETDDGASILKPIPDKIRELRDEIFTAEGAASPAAQGTDLLDLVKQENARVLVRNGTFTQGLGTRTADYLTSLGFNIVDVNNAEATNLTRVIDYTGNPYALQFFRSTFGMTSPSQIVFRYDPTSEVDIEVILGSDWANNNSMP